MNLRTVQATDRDKDDRTPNELGFRTCINSRNAHKILSLSFWLTESQQTFVKKTINTEKEKFGTHTKTFTVASGKGEASGFHFFCAVFCICSCLQQTWVCRKKPYFFKGLIVQMGTRNILDSVMIFYDYLLSNVFRGCSLCNNICLSLSENANAT